MLVEECDWGSSAFLNYDFVFANGYLLDAVHNVLIQSTSKQCFDSICNQVNEAIIIWKEDESNDSVFTDYLPETTKNLLTEPIFKQWYILSAEYEYLCRFPASKINLDGMLAKSGTVSEGAKYTTITESERQQLINSYANKLRDLSILLSKCESYKLLIEGCDLKNCGCDKTNCKCEQKNRTDIFKVC